MVPPSGLMVPPVMVSLTMKVPDCTSSTPARVRAMLGAIVTPGASRVSEPMLATSSAMV